MMYTSTRDGKVRVPSAAAIANGISPDGGLYVPQSIPQIDRAFIKKLAAMDYEHRAAEILSLYLTDFSYDELLDYACKAYGGGKFSSKDRAPVRSLGENAYVLELWRGPTCAFKDMALQILPFLLTASCRKIGSDKTRVILVATSGDTGKAALEGFRDVPGTRILVFYPCDGVSNMQKLQMATQEGANVGVAAIRGNFDDAQNGVKAIFTNASIKDAFDKNGCAFSSANSINWGRLVPQIVYYFSAYCDLMNKGAIEPGDKINFTVPTGNFGDILAAWYAAAMGLPVNRLICASNANNVLTDFLETGVYDRNRRFYTTCSPSMDILISSNLERLLFMLAGYDDARVREWFGCLAENGKYTVGTDVMKRINGVFEQGYCDDKQTKNTISRIFRERNYLCDTHTGVAFNVYYQYRARTGDSTPTVIASTASPFKFPAAVLDAIKYAGTLEGTYDDEFAAIRQLEQATGISAPVQLSSLEGREPRFTGVYDREEMSRVVLDMLGIG
ncbi:MAG: threonine synthase [Clostridia bacterium]|nr:threonine synthase [Clostridia bacterium]